LARRLISNDNEHRGCLTAAPDEPAAEGEDAPPGQLPDAGPDEAPPPVPDGLRDVHGRERALVSRTLDRHAAVHELLRAGRSQREAAEILGLSRNTVNRLPQEYQRLRVFARPSSTSRNAEQRNHSGCHVLSEEQPPAPPSPSRSTHGATASTGEPPTRT
jgi:hypothetical protein